MTIGERIRKVRKSLKMNLDDFGAKVGVTGPLISLMENGKASITDRTIRGICREFNVSETWLRTGEGDAYKTFDSELEKLVKERGLSHQDYIAIRNYMELTQKERDAVTTFMIRFALDVSHAGEDGEGSVEIVFHPAPPNVHDMTRAEMEAELARQMDAEEADRKGGTGGTSGSGRGNSETA